MKLREKTKIIVITGAESTGKSVLTQRLGEHFNSPYYPEYAREYLELKGPSYSMADVEQIARVQKAQMDEAVKREAPFLFFDTWLIITKVWMEIVFGSVPAWIPEEISRAPVDLFLLCANDIPWLPDPLRENGGEMRQRLFEIYRSNLEQYNFKYRIIKGKGDDRFNHALQIIRENL
mgnify:CR=1 FL=1